MVRLEDTRLVHHGDDYTRGPAQFKGKLYNWRNDRGEHAMSLSRQTLGQRGEQFVTGWLRREGYTILARNWRSGASGEMDIVAQQADTVVFVEVRTRRGPLEAAIAAALESVTAAKRARLLRLAQAFLAEQGWTDVAVAGRRCRSGVS